MCDSILGAEHGTAVCGSDSRYISKLADGIVAAYNSRRVITSGRTAETQSKSSTRLVAMAKGRSKTPPKPGRIYLKDSDSPIIQKTRDLRIHEKIILALSSLSGMRVRAVESWLQPVEWTGDRQLTLRQSTGELISPRPPSSLGGG